MDFTAQVKEARPNIKANSAAAYATSLRLLAPDGTTSLDFLKDTEQIIGKLEKYKHTTRRNYLNAVIVVMRGMSGSDKQPKIYEKLRDKYNEEYADQVQIHRRRGRGRRLTAR